MVINLGKSHTINARGRVKSRTKRINVVPDEEKWE